MYDELDFSILQGKTLTEITGSAGDDVMRFRTSNGEVYRLFHYSDCCESVTVEDIVGSLDDVIGSPIVLAEEVTSLTNPDDIDMRDRYQDSFTWTFYKLATAKGRVTIRWYGESNGYYSESVSFEKESASE